MLGAAGGCPTAISDLAAGVSAPELLMKKLLELFDEFIMLVGDALGFRVKFTGVSFIV